MSRSTLVSAEFPAGEYYIGDLCYVMHKEWDEFCDLTISPEGGCLNGEFTLADGRRFFFGQTSYGDGVYHDNRGNEYPVDAGLIGIIAVKDISAEDQKNLNLGAVHNFPSNIYVEAENGVFYFGYVCIDTAHEEDEEEDEYEYGEEDEY